MSSFLSVPDSNVLPQSSQNLLYIPNRAVCQLELWIKRNPEAISYVIQEEVIKRIQALNPVKSFVLSGVNMNNNMFANNRYTDSGVLSLPNKHRSQDSLARIMQWSDNKILYSERLASVKFSLATKWIAAPKEYQDAIANLNVKNIDWTYDILTERHISPRERDILSSIGAIGRCFALVEVSFWQEEYDHVFETSFEELIMSN
jgi:hypothetical protein